MRIGLTLDEYVDLKVRPHSGADRVFHQAAEQESWQSFPMHTAAAATHLRSRGYDVRPEMLDLLVEDGVVKLAKKDAWTEKDVERAAEHQAYLNAPALDMGHIYLHVPANCG